MNRLFSIAIFLLLLSTICFAGGKKQNTDAKPTTQTQQQAVQPTPPPPASLYWTGDGGKGVSLAILAPKTNGLADNLSYLASVYEVGISCCKYGMDEEVNA